MNFKDENKKVHNITAFIDSIFFLTFIFYKMMKYDQHIFINALNICSIFVTFLTYIYCIFSTFILYNMKKFGSLYLWNRIYIKRLKLKICTENMYWIYVQNAGKYWISFMEGLFFKKVKNKTNLKQNQIKIEELDVKHTECQR